MFELKLKQGNLLAEALSPLMILGQVALIECSPEPDGFLLQTTDITNLFFAEIRVHRGNFIRFFVDVLYMVAANLTEFHSILSTTNDEEDLTITYHHEHNSDFLRFTFEDTTGVHPVRDKDLDLFDYPCKQVNWDTSQLNFDVVVGIPSPDFRRIYDSLSEFGDIVRISVTAEVVTFTTEPRQIVLVKENGSCIIAGAGETPVCFVIILQHMETCLETSYMWASQLSDTIWMLWSHDGCAQLNFPFWPLGNIMYYYIQG